jgi:D-alanyl-D-alanine carboxypeptidase
VWGVVLLLVLCAGGLTLAVHVSAALTAEAPSVEASGSASSSEAANSEQGATVPTETPAAEENTASATPVSETNSVTSSEVDPVLGLTPAEAATILADPLMVLVNHDNAMPENYTFDTAKCGSKTSVNNTLQTVACEAFLQMQTAAAADGVTVWMKSGYRSVAYQTTLYNNKVQYYLNKGYDDATARTQAATIVNPPGYSEHNCGLAADLNSPEHTGLDEGFENTNAFTWLCANAEKYGFILRYPKGDEAKAVTDITYEPWHWRYVGAENAARINASGLYFEQYIAALQELAAKA